RPRVLVEDRARHPARRPGGGHGRPPGRGAGAPDRLGRVAGDRAAGDLHRARRPARLSMTDPQTIAELVERSASARGASPWLHFADQIYSLEEAPERANVSPEPLA